MTTSSLTLANNVTIQGATQAGPRLLTYFDSTNQVVQQFYSNDAGIAGTLIGVSTVATRLMTTSTQTIANNVQLQTAAQTAPRLLTYFDSTNMAVQQWYFDDLQTQGTRIGVSSITTSSAVIPYIQTSSIFWANGNILASTISAIVFTIEASTMTVSSINAYFNYLQVSSIVTSSINAFVNNLQASSIVASTITAAIFNIQTSTIGTKSRCSISGDNLTKSGFAPTSVRHAAKRSRNLSGSCSERSSGVFGEETLMQI
jgi:hypothetical protein